MGQVKRQDLRQFSILGITTLQNIGELGVGALAEGVPANMRRYAYYYRAENVDPGLVIGTIYENLGGVLTPKDTFVLTSTSGNFPKDQNPPGGVADPERPILSFRQSGFMAVQTSSPGSVGSGRVLLTFGYYDAPPQ